MRPMWNCPTVEVGWGRSVFSLLKKVHKKKICPSYLYINLEENVMSVTMAAVLPLWRDEYNPAHWEWLSRQMKSFQLPMMSLCCWIIQYWKHLSVDILWCEIINLLVCKPLCFIFFSLQPKESPTTIITLTPNSNTWILWSLFCVM